MSNVGDPQQAACLPSKHLTETSDALRQYMMPHLDLEPAVALAGTCTACRSLITHTPLHQLSESTRRAVLPAGLTSELGLLELIEQQAQLLARLRGKQSFSPRIQHLIFREDVGLTSDQPGSAEQSEHSHGRPLRFEQLIWSPCARFEEASRWIVLDPESESKVAPIVVDTRTGQQICLQDTSMPTHFPELHADWLRSDSHLLFHPSRKYRAAANSPVGTCLADVGIKKISTVTLPGAEHWGTSLVFQIGNGEGATKDILAWIAAPVPSMRRENHIIVYDADSWQPMYQLACPDNIFESFMQRHMELLTPTQNASPEEEAMSFVIFYKVILSPNTKQFAVLWQLYLCSFTDEHSNVDGYSGLPGLSIHHAMTGECLHSMELKPQTFSGDRWETSAQMRWLPCSSKLMYTDSTGVHLITSAGQLLWSNFASARDPDWALYQMIPGTAKTWSSASPCGCWILVVDSFFPMVGVSYQCQLPKGRLASILDASTGAVLHCHTSGFSLEKLAIWSESGRVCFLPAAALVLAACRDTDGTPWAFKSLELLSIDGCLADSGLILGKQPRSMSPCGSFVVGLEMDADLKPVSLQHWRLPAASALDHSLVEAVEPMPCAELLVPDPSEHVAWHPLQSAAVYAAGSHQGGVYLVDARVGKCIKSWSEDELHGPARSFNNAQVTSSADWVGEGEYDDGDDSDQGQGKLLHIFEWSKDGRRLAIASCGSATSGTRCSVLDFGDHFS